MWKDWLERTLTRNKAPVMLASEIMCVEPANSNVAEAAATPVAETLARADKVPEPVEVQ
jgi:hypothetical protein